MEQMRLLFRILHRKGYAVSLDRTRSTFLYKEPGRSMRVLGETMPDGYAVYSSSIREWETLPTELITDSERQRIATNIRSYFIDRGKNIYLT
jgi:hypothetical protein